MNRCWIMVLCWNELVLARGLGGRWTWTSTCCKVRWTLFWARCSDSFTNYLDLMAGLHVPRGGVAYVSPLRAPTAASINADLNGSNADLNGSIKMTGDEPIESIELSDLIFRIRVLL